LKGVFKRPWWPFGKNKAAGVEVGRAHLLNLPVFGPTGFLIQGFEGLLNHWDAILDGQFDPSPNLPAEILAAGHFADMDKVKATLEKLKPYLTARLDRPYTYAVEGTHVFFQLEPKRLQELVWRDIEALPAHPPGDKSPTPQSEQYRHLWHENQADWAATFDTFTCRILSGDEEGKTMVTYLPEPNGDGGTPMPLPVTRDDYQRLLAEENAEDDSAQAA
ncbi:MAG: hypothetical protein KC474_08065, partial [Cyanobacteria bacterium HKST-UBA04]|nr:hypothetical protein [Cyanobacteria bacterium HKST-UBA04]